MVVVAVVVVNAERGAALTRSKFELPFLDVTPAPI